MQNVIGTSNQNTGLEVANDLNFVNSNFFQTFESLLFYIHLQIITSIVICHVLYFKNIKAHKALKELTKKFTKIIYLIVLQIIKLTN